MNVMKMGFSVFIAEMYIAWEIEFERFSSETVQKPKSVRRLIGCFSHKSGKKTIVW